MFNLADWKIPYVRLLVFWLLLLVIILVFVPFSTQDYSSRVKLIEGLVLAIGNSKEIKEFYQQQQHCPTAQDLPHIAAIQGKYVKSLRLASNVNGGACYIIATMRNDMDLEPLIKGKSILIALQATKGWQLKTTCKTDLNSFILNCGILDGGEE